MKTDPAANTRFYLPDFCTSRAALAIVLIVELTALRADARTPERG